MMTEREPMRNLKIELPPFLGRAVGIPERLHVQTDVNSISIVVIFM
jgi:hypothetical protein